MSVSAFDRLLSCSDWISCRCNRRATTSSCRKLFFKAHPTIGNLFETISSRPFRDEIEALGGYDTRETGKLMRLSIMTGIDEGERHVTA